MRGRTSAVHSWQYFPAQNRFSVTTRSPHPPSASSTHQPGYKNDCPAILYPVHSWASLPWTRTLAAAALASFFSWMRFAASRKLAMKWLFLRWKCMPWIMLPDRSTSATAFRSSRTTHNTFFFRCPRFSDCSEWNHTGGLNSRSGGVAPGFSGRNITCSLTTRPSPAMLSASRMCSKPTLR